MIKFQVLPVAGANRDLHLEDQKVTWKKLVIFDVLPIFRLICGKVFKRKSLSSWEFLD